MHELTYHKHAAYQPLDLPAPPLLPLPSADAAELVSCTPLRWYIKHRLRIFIMENNDCSTHTIHQLNDICVCMVKKICRINRKIPLSKSLVMNTTNASWYLHQSFVRIHSYTRGARLNWQNPLRDVKQQQKPLMILIIFRNWCITPNKSSFHLAKIQFKITHIEMIMDERFE